MCLEACVRETGSMSEGRNESGPKTPDVTGTGEDLKAYLALLIRFAEPRGFREMSRHLTSTVKEVVFNDVTFGQHTWHITRLTRKIQGAESTTYLVEMSRVTPPSVKATHMIEVPK